MDLRLSDPRVQPVAGIVSPKPEQADEILELPARTLLEFAATTISQDRAEPNWRLARRCYREPLDTGNIGYAQTELDFVSQGSNVVGEEALKGGPMP
jgi:hypothetical protein